MIGLNLYLATLFPGTDLIFRDKEITSTSGLKYLVHEAAPQLYALRGAEMTTEDGLTLNFVEGQP